MDFFFIFIVIEFIVSNLKKIIRKQDTTPVFVNIFLKIIFVMVEFIVQTTNIEYIFIITTYMSLLFFPMFNSFGMWKRIVMSRK